MVKGTRIRWVNVARLAAGAIGCVALVLGMPALLERPEPPPLPSDVGLSPAAMPPSGQLRAARSEPEHHRAAHIPKERPPERKASPRDREPRRPARRREAEPGPPPRAPREPRQTPVAAPAPAPAPPPPAPPPAPEPAYVPPPTAPPPAPEPQPASPPPSSGPPEFGFEH